MIRKTINWTYFLYFFLNFNLIEERSATETILRVFHLFKFNIIKNRETRK